MGLVGSIMGTCVESVGLEYKNSCSDAVFYDTVAGPLLIQECIRLGSMKYPRTVQFATKNVESPHPL